MRWIVLALLLANVGLFAWFQGGDRGSRSPAAVPEQPVTEARGGDTIRLLGEVDPGSLPARQGGPAAAAEPPAAAGPEPAPSPERDPDSASAGKKNLCTLFGPFEEGDQGEDVVQRLRALDLQAELRSVEVEGAMRYWVYLDPLGSRREAFNRLRELQAAGVDSYVIPKGSLANGISFGIFSELDRAESLTAELQGQGIEAHMREEPQIYLEQWVVLPPGAAEALGEDFWSQLQLDFPELDRRRNLCSELEAD